MMSDFQNDLTLTTAKDQLRFTPRQKAWIAYTNHWHIVKALQQTVNVMKSVKARIILRSQKGDLLFTNISLCCL